MAVGETKPAADGADEWFLGETARNKGSLHSDCWTGSAFDLAEKWAICVYPVSGWWKDEKSKDRSNFGVRHALVASIESKAEDLDIWTPVAQQIGATIKVE